MHQSPHPLLGCNKEGLYIPKLGMLWSVPRLGTILEVQRTPTAWSSPSDQLNNSVFGNGQL